MSFAEAGTRGAKEVAGDRKIKSMPREKSNPYYVQASHTPL